MKFELTSDQRDFASALESLLSASDTTAVSRAWGSGDTEPGLTLWGRLAEQGVNALLVPEDEGGMGASPVEMAIAFEALGRHAVPGPWVESAAFLPVALAGSGNPLQEELAEGLVATLAAAPQTPFALDGDAGARIFVVATNSDGTGSLNRATAGEVKKSMDPARRLMQVSAAEALAEIDAERLKGAFDAATLATAAYLLGAGERVLADTVTYVKQRKQFGREIGSYQAIKHQLADVRINLDFVRPLVLGAALGDVPASAAKVFASEKVYAASRTALQLHGAIGYTAEFDLSIWLTRIRALVNSWGTPAEHRAQLLAGLLDKHRQEA